MKKNGFTLVELIAVIAILGVLLVMFVPNLINSINSRKEESLNKVYDIIETSTRNYVMDYNISTPTKIELQDLCDATYIDCPIINPVDNKELDGCVKILDSIGETYTYGSCETINVPFSVQMNGGTGQTFQSSYQEFTRIELIEPTHTTADFKGWQIVKGNSTIKGNTLIIGTTETILYANWEHYPKLTVDLDGGNDTIDYNEGYKSGTVITLKKPTRAGYKFTGWIVTTGNSVVSGNNLTMGSEDTIVKATWEEAVVQAIYSATENSLTFINTKLQTEGGTYNGKEVTKVYTGFEIQDYTTYYTVPWWGMRNSIKKVEFLDEIFPVSTAYWFNELEECDSMDLSNLDTSNVTNMKNMFYSTGRNSAKFTLELGDKFDTSNVTNMHNMFKATAYSSTVFTLDLGDKFDTSNVTDMHGMFSGTGYSSPVFTLDLGDKFDTSNVTDMYGMFSNTGYSSPVFTLDLGDKFDTSNVPDMTYMFNRTGYKSTVFTLDLGDKFDTSSVTNMSSMFYRTGYSSPVFTLDLGDKFDTSSVTNMSSMFNETGYKSTVFTLDLGGKFKFKDGVSLDYFEYNCPIKKLIIPATVTNIPSSTFSGMSKLTEIVFEHSSTDSITLPTAGSSTGAFYTSTALSTTVTTTNDTIKNYDWASDNRTVTFN